MEQPFQQPFQTIRSRKKRRRQQTTDDGVETAVKAATPGQRRQQEQYFGVGGSQNTNTIRGAGKSLMIGRKSCDPASSMNNYNRNKCPITAVKPIVRQKAVFCIDNVSPSISATEMADFITDDLSIEVLSIFDAKTRRRRNDSNFADRKAFRVCINKYDVDRLLVPDLWPQGIAISEWYFKGKASDAVGVNANAGINETNEKSVFGGGMRHVVSSDSTESSTGTAPFASTDSTTGNAQSSLNPKCTHSEAVKNYTVIRNASTGYTDIDPDSADTHKLASAASSGNNWSVEPVNNNLDAGDVGDSSDSSDMTVENHSTIIYAADVTILSNQGHVQSADIEAIAPAKLTTADVERGNPAAGAAISGSVSNSLNSNTVVDG